jgi:phosphate transport system substrate-binding protein
MKMIRLVVPLAVAATLAAQSARQADPALPAYVPTAKVTGTLAGVGPDTMEVLMNRWIAAFTKYQPGARVTERVVETGPEDRTALGPNTAEIFHTDDTPYRDKYHYEPFRVRVSMASFNAREHIQALGVYVSASNPLDQISLAQLDAIYSTTRRRGYPAAITTWGQLGLAGDWAGRPIHVYSRRIGGDEVTEYFRDVVMDDGTFGNLAPLPPAKPRQFISARVVAAVAGDPDGIGFSAFAYQTPGVKALALEDGRGVLGQPVEGDVAGGRYPLARPLYLYVNRPPGAPLDPVAREFLSFVLSREGQEIVAREGGYLPLPPAIAAAEREKLP